MAATEPIMPLEVGLKKMFGHKLEYKKKENTWNILYIPSP